MSTSDLIEDAAKSAAQQFRLAHQYCGTCRSYHAMWGYVQLGGLRNKGVDLDRERLEPLISHHAPPASRILIAGAADAASLALARSAIRGTTAHIVVADRCETPLAVCRTYADAHEFALTTLRVDIAHSRPEGSYDLVLAHLVLMFVPHERRVGFLRNLGRSLSEGGRLLLVHRSRRRPRDVDPESEMRRFAERVLAGLSERGIQLPDSEGRVRQDLEEYCAARRQRDEDPIGLERVVEYLNDAGFHISDCVDYQRPMELVADNASGSHSAQTRVFVAAFQG